MLIRKQTMVYPAVAAALVTLATAATAFACGGFFCQQVTIDQAGEQIIFRRDGPRSC